MEIFCQSEKVGTLKIHCTVGFYLLHIVINSNYLLAWIDK